MIRIFKLLGICLLMTGSAFAEEEELFLNFEFQLKNADGLIVSKSSVRAVTDGQEVDLIAAIKAPNQMDIWQVELQLYNGLKTIEVEIYDLGRVSSFMRDGNSNFRAHTLFNTKIPFQGYGDHQVFEMDGVEFHVVVTLLEQEKSETEAAEKE